MYIYKKPTNVYGNKLNGKNGKTKVIFANGCPYEKDQILKVNFKNKQIVAKVARVNEGSVSVNINGEDHLKNIKFERISKIIM